MDVVTIILFFVYTWGLGYASTRFIKKYDDPLESNLMNIGIGLSIFIVLSLLLNLLRIPLDWRIYLVLGGIVPLFFFFRSIKNGKIPQFNMQLKKSDIYVIVVLLLFVFSFYMYLKGAFAYPYLEDDDPWNHAMGVKYVSQEKTAFAPTGIVKVLNYIDAYPPAYDIILGVLHQTSPDLMWTMKFFNALIISLGIIFFYFFVKHFTGSRGKALFSTFALAMIPCYLSHFIWSHALIPTLFFVIIYCLEQIKYSRSWIYISAVVIGAIPLIQPEQPIKIGVMLFVYWAVKAATQKRLSLNIIGPVVCGYVIGLILWWIPMLIKYGSKISEGLTGTTESVVLNKGFIGPLGSATRFYTFSDIFVAKSQNMINNPIGIGMVLSLLACISIVFILIMWRDLKLEKGSYKLIALLWFFFSFMGLYGGTVFPIALMSFRFWMIVAFTTSIIVSEGVWLLLAVGKSVKINKGVIITLLVTLIWFTSGQQKFAVNTAQWGPGGWLGPAPGALYSFLWMKQNIPMNTPVFTYSLINTMTVGFGLYSCEWCQDVIEFRKNISNKSIQEQYSFLKENDYKYVMIDEYYSREIGVNQTISLINDMVNSELFNFMYQAEANGNKLPGFVLKVN